MITSGSTDQLKPVVFLAFANEQEGRRYLREIPEEVRQLRQVLQEAKDRGLCELEVRTNVTFPEVVGVFNDYGSRVAIFHFGGHAGPDCLLLESAEVAARKAHAEGLAGFLGLQGGLQLVFLNGCSTGPQVTDLLKGGIDAVVATARPIDDKVAREFAVAFYTQLGKGRTFRDAFTVAGAQVKANHGGTPRDLIGVESPFSIEDVADDFGFPWKLHVRDGAEKVEQESLPKLARQPLLGLPPLPPATWLPPTPFRHLQRFTQEEAHVFFGRGHEIADLYALVTSPTSRRVILYSGATGVGKSSVLDAGVLPRLTGTHEVVYLRRDATAGLLGTLIAGLKPPGGGSAPAPDLAALWRAGEASGKALVVVLDQAEEAFTRPRSEMTPADEVAELVQALQSLFQAPAQSPRDRLILAFRKEWLQEFERAHDDARLGYDSLRLGPLDHDGIVEAIEGPTLTDDLRRHYGLTIAPGLADSIAVELERDAGSALAPTLQVLLSKMWTTAGAKGASFTPALYDRLKDEGFLLNDVVEEGLKALKAWRPDVVDSGFALDVLEHHTTPFGTAETRTRAELLDRYGHRADLLDECLRLCEGSYLLIPAGTEPGEREPVPTRLGHDTLAPLVRERFRASMAAGQRARRLLENRTSEWKGGKTGHTLYGTDLAAVETGASGMRVWSEDERRLIDASRRAEERRVADEVERQAQLREARDREEQERLAKEHQTKLRLEEQREANRRLRQRAYVLVAMLAATIVLAGLAGIAGLEWKASAIVAHNQSENAKKQTEIAKEQTKKAKKSAEEAESQTRIARVQARIATSRQLAALSATERNTRFDRSLLLAVAALQTEKTSEARESLYVALQDRPGLTSFLHSNQGSVTGVAFSPDGKTLAAASGGAVVLWDMGARNRLGDEPLAVKEGIVNGVAFSPDGKTLAAGFGTKSGGVVLWDVATRKRLGDEPLAVKEAYVTGVAFSPDGKSLAAGFGSGVVLWDVAARKRLGDVPLAVEGPVRGVAFSPDGKTLAAGVGSGFGGGVELWDVAARKRLGDEPLALKGASVRCVAFSPDGKVLAAGFGAGLGGLGDGGVVLWDVAARKPLGNEPLTVNEKAGAATGVAFSPDGKTLAAGFGNEFVVGAGSVVLWDVAARTRLGDEPFAAKEGAVTGVAFSPDGKTLAAGFISGDTGRVVVDRGGFSGVMLWNVAARGRLADELVAENEGSVTDVAFSPDGKTLAAGSGGDVMLWDVAARKGLGAVPLTVKEGAVRGVAFSPDGKTLVAGFDRGVVLWDVAARDRLGGGPLAVKGGAVRGVAFSPDGKTLAAGLDLGFFVGGMVLWDVATRRPLGDEPLALKEGIVAGMAFSPDGKTLAAGFGVPSGGMVLWDVASRKRRGDKPLAVKEGFVTGVAFSPDGKTLAAGFDKVVLGVFVDSHVGGVALWDVAARTSLGDAPLAVKEGYVTGVAFSPDGKTLAAGFSVGVGVSGAGVVLWDVAARKRLGGEPLAVKGTATRGVAFSPDGKTLATGLGSGVVGVVLWDLDLESWQRIAGRTANRNFTWDEWRQYCPDEPFYRRIFPDLPDGEGVAEARLAQQKMSRRPSLSK